MSLAVTLPLALAAGALTVLSPCVLPLAPIIVSSARAADWRGPFALAAGLALTFGVGGGALASAGVEVGGSEWARAVAAALMVVVGIVMVTPSLALRLESALSGAGNLAQGLGRRLPNAGLMGQAGAGALLALAWAPCAGPTLGAAFALAAQGGSAPAAMLIMAIYALGAVGALLALGYGLGKLAGRSRGVARAAGEVGRYAMGGAFALVGAAILTGFDHRIEAALIDVTPNWLTTFVTSI